MSRIGTLSLMAGLAGLTSIGGCFEEGCDNLVNQLAGCTRSVTIQVELRNQATDGMNIHILEPGETFAPSNQLAPGANRFVTIGYDPKSSGAEFRAGRNQLVLSSVTCVAQDPSATRADGGAKVTWNGLGLTCTRWDPP